MTIAISVHASLTVIQFALTMMTMNTMVAHVLDQDVDFVTSV